MSLSALNLDRAKEILKDRLPSRSFVLGAGTGVGLYLLAKHGPSGLLKAAVGGILASARAMPGVGALLEQAEGAALQSIVDELAPPDPSAITALPGDAASSSSLLSEIRSLLDKDMASSGFLKGKAFAGIYHHPLGELTDLQSQVMTAFINTNLLYPGIFRSARKFEAETVAMVVSMLKGKLGLDSDPSSGKDADPAPDACGLLTTGGTESILLATKAYREAAFSKRGISSSSSSSDALEVICGLTAHPAIDKACHYLGLKLVKLPVDESNGQLRPEDVAKAINANTIFVYASAPEFCHGVCDPIPELAALAHSKGVGLHVDNCVGGVLLSYMQREQEQNPSAATTALAPIPLFDFRVPGVTSVSCDAHKYGNAPKGASVVAFRDQQLRRHCYVTVTDWPGGLYATPTVTGSRSGANAATAWATLRFMGGKGYQSMASEVAGLMDRMVAGINAIPELKVIGGRPHACIVSFTTNGSVASFDAYSLAARMDEKGHHLNSLQSPPGAAVVVTERMSETIDDWLRCLHQCVEEARKNPSDPKYQGKGSAGIYGASAVLPPSEVGRILQRYCDVLTLVRPAKKD